MSDKEITFVSPAGISTGDEKTVDVFPAEVPVLSQFPDDSEDFYPEGGRGWLVVAGCFLQASVTLGMIRPPPFSLRYLTLLLPVVWNR